MKTVVGTAPTRKGQTFKKVLKLHKSKDKNNPNDLIAFMPKSKKGERKMKSLVVIVKNPVDEKGIPIVAGDYAQLEFTEYKDKRQAFANVLKKVEPSHDIFVDESKGTIGYRLLAKEGNDEVVILFKIFPESRQNSKIHRAQLAAKIAKYCPEHKSYVEYTYGESLEQLRINEKMCHESVDEAVRILERLSDVSTGKGKKVNLTQEALEDALWAEIKPWEKVPEAGVLASKVRERLNLVNFTGKHFQMEMIEENEKEEVEFGPNLQDKVVQEKIKQIFE